MATAKIADTGIDLAGIANLANLFLGKTSVAQNSGGTQTTGTRTVSESVDPAAVQATVKSILEGTSGLAAVSSGQRKAGLYNSSTNQLLTNDLVARTAAEASKLNKTTTTSVNEGTVDNRSTTTVTQPPISSQTAGKGALLLGGLSLIPADVRKNLLGFGKKAATANAATPSDAQSIFRKGEIADQNAGDSTAAIVSNPVSGNSGVNSITGTGIGATGNDANIVSLGGDDGSGLADTVLSDAGSGLGFDEGTGLLGDLGGSALVDSIDPGIVGDYGDLPDFDYDNFDLGFAEGGLVDASGRRKANTDIRVSEEAKAEMPAYGFDGLTIGEIQDLKKEKDRIRSRYGEPVRSKYAEGGPVNTGLRNTPLVARAESDPTEITQVVGSLTGRIGSAGDRTTGGTRPTNTVNTGAGKGIQDLQPSESTSGSTSGDDTGTNAGSVGNAANNAAVVNGLAPFLTSLVTMNPIMGLVVKATQSLAGIPTQSINPISQIVTAIANTASGNASEAPDDAPTPEGSVSVGTPIGDDGVAMAGFTGSIQGNDPTSADTGVGSAPDIGTVGGDVGASSDVGGADADGSAGSSSGDAGDAGDAGGSDSGGDGYTEGGSISGPGSATSDSIPISVSDGEFVMNAEAVKAFGPIIEHMNNLGRKMMDKKSGYARGGMIKTGRK